MCRHLAYAGPAVPLSRWLFDAPHSLAHQSWAPRDMRGGGTINADGFGAGWFTPAGPVRYRRATPLWSDATLPGLAATLPAGGVLAAVRSATVGMPVTETAAAPFAGDGWLFSHNGVVAGWPGSVAKLAAGLPVTDLLTLEAPTDAALLWALVRDRLRHGAGPAEAVADVVAEVVAAAPGSRLNLLLTDGGTIVATTLGHALSVRHSRADAEPPPAARGGTDPGGTDPGGAAPADPAPGDFVLVASEPLDDVPGWRAVPDGTLLVASAADLVLYPLGVS